MRNLAALCLAAIVLVVAAGASGEPDESILPAQVQAAKLCAAEAATVRDAYRALRDHLRGSADAARAEALLSEAEDALTRARSACRDDADASRSFEALAADSEIIRRALGTPRR